MRDENGPGRREARAAVAHRDRRFNIQRATAPQPALRRPLTSLSRDPVGFLLPGCRDPYEREARRRLGICRDLASAKLAVLPPGHAQALCWIILEEAAAMVFAPATIDQLQETLRQCQRLLMCARWAEERGVQCDEN